MRHTHSLSWSLVFHLTETLAVYAIVTSRAPEGAGFVDTHRTISAVNTVVAAGCLASVQVDTHRPITAINSLTAGCLASIGRVPPGAVQVADVAGSSVAQRLPTTEHM